MTEKKAVYATLYKPPQTLAEIAANVASLQAQLNAQGLGPRDLKAELVAARQRIEEMAQTQADSIRLVADQTRRIMDLERENKTLIKQSLERAAETCGLRNQVQVYWLEIEELRASLLGLVAGLAGLPENWIVQYEAARCLQAQIDVACDCLGRAGLLTNARGRGDKVSTIEIGREYRVESDELEGLNGKTVVALCSAGKAGDTEVFRCQDADGHTWDVCDCELTETEAAQ